MLFSSHILAFYKQLQLDTSLPDGISLLNPYTNAYTFSLCEQFYTKYYNDDKPRTLLLGINPGRLGSGTTGISFTDPILLEQVCGITNTLQKKAELSATFIYRVIEAFGGVHKFYDAFFISAISPLGFTKDGKNMNYYDDKKLTEAVTPFIINSITQLLKGNINRTHCYCIGEGKNLTFLTALNTEHQWFKKIIPLAHPRFIMQYKRKHVGEYISRYINLLQESH